MNSAGSNFFIFTIETKTLGLRLAAIERVLPAAELMAGSRHAPGLAGFLNYRGKAIPVLNFREVLGIPDRPLYASDQIVLARAWGAELGFIVDCALGVHESHRLQIFPEELGAMRNNLGIEGFMPMGERLILIQDLETFLVSNMPWFHESIQDAGAQRGVVIE